MTMIHTHPDRLTAEARNTLLAEIHHACLTHVLLRRGKERSPASPFLPAVWSDKGSAELGA